MALKKHEIQYLIKVLTFYNEYTELKNDNERNRLGKAIGTEASFKLLNRELAECSDDPKISESQKNNTSNEIFKEGYEAAIESLKACYKEIFK